MAELQADIARRVKKDSKAGIPPGGGAGRVLTKASPDDYDAAWMPIDQDSLPNGGTIGQVLTKRSYVDQDADWEDATGGGGGSFENVADASFYSASPTVVDANGVNTAFTLDSSTATQTWLDGSGNIIEPGIYLIGYYIGTQTPFTGVSVLEVVGNLWNDYGAQFITSDLVDVTAINHPDLSHVGWQFSEPTPLGAGDVPFAVGGHIQVETDATGQVQMWPFVVRLSGLPSGGGGGALTTDSYYEFIDDGTTTGKAFNAGSIENKWMDTGLSAFNNGSDVTLASGVVTIANTGVYSIAATWYITADTAADAYSFTQGRFTLNRTNEPGSPSHDQVFLDDVKTPAVLPATNKHVASFAVAMTAFMFAGDSVTTECEFSAGTSPGSTWSFQTASMYLERLA